MVATGARVHRLYRLRPPAQRRLNKMPPGCKMGPLVQLPYRCDCQNLSKKKMLRKNLIIAPSR